MSDSHDDNELLKKYLNDTNDSTFNPDHSLNKALKAAKAKTATRDVFTLFTSWVWVVFAGFGASVHSEITKRKHPASSQAKRAQVPSKQVSKQSKQKKNPPNHANKKVQP